MHPTNQSSPYTTPLMGLFCVLVVVTFGALLANKKLNAAKLEFRSVEAGLAETRQAISVQEQSLASITAASKPVDVFMNGWASHLNGGDGNAILNDLSRFGNEQTVSVQGRRSSTGESMWQGGMVPIAYAHGTAVSNEYFRLLNWLGKVEQAWPLSRFEQVSFQQRGGTLSLDVRIAYPTFILDRLSK